MKCKDCQSWERLGVNHVGYCPHYDMHMKENMEFKDCKYGRKREPIFFNEISKEMRGLLE